MWDNRFTLHYAVRDYAEPRRMMRIGLAGEKPLTVGDFSELQRASAA